VTRTVSLQDSSSRSDQPNQTGLAAEETGLSAILGVLRKYCDAWLKAGVYEDLTLPLAPAFREVSLEAIRAQFKEAGAAIQTAPASLVAPEVVVQASARHLSRTELRRARKRKAAALGDDA